MKKEWVKYLCDPVDRSNLVLHSISKVVDGYVVTGVLKSKSGNIYKIKNGVPVFLNKKTQKVSTVDSFAYEWNEFDFDYGKNGWIEGVIRPSLGGLKFFEGKVVADCGAGSGRQSLWMARAGAKFVFSFELSNAAYTIIKKVTKECRDKIFVIQADISHPPIKARTAKIDLVYCINVIQHTWNPKATTIELSNLMTKRSLFLFNIYMEKGRKFILKLLSLVRLLTAHIPFGLLKYLSLTAAILFYTVALLPISRKIIKNYLPIDHGLKETWLCLYDILGSHKYQKFYSEEELKDILKASSLKIIRRSKYTLLLSKK